MDENRADGSTDTVPPNDYEAAARKLFELDPAAHCRLLGIPVTGQPEILPRTLPPITLPGDVLLLRVAPDHLAHIIHVLDRPEDLDVQMLLYRMAIMRAYPGNEVSQYVIVLGDGPDDPPDSAPDDDDAEPVAQPYV